MAARETPRRLENVGLLLLLLLDLSASSDHTPVAVVTESTEETPTEYFTTANIVEDSTFPKNITSFTAIKDVEQQSKLRVQTTIAPVNVTPVSSAPAQNGNATQVEEKKGVISTATVLISKFVKPKTSTDADSTGEPTTDDYLMFDTQDVVGTDSLPTNEDDGDDQYSFDKEYDTVSINSNNLGKAETSNKEPTGVDYESDSDDYEYKLDDSHDEDSHFFLHLVLIGLLIVVVYIAYHNKRKIFLLVQKRRWRDSLCSKNAAYHRLDQNVNEAMPSLKRTNIYNF